MNGSLVGLLVEDRKGLCAVAEGEGEEVQEVVNCDETHAGTGIDNGVVPVPTVSVEPGDAVS
ncbi:hypothetical protein THIOSC15_2100007 [uncultured Thiomicrorhabdus sp.]